MKKIVISIIAVVILVLIVFARVSFFNKKSPEPLTSPEQLEQEWTRQLQNKELHKPVDLPIEDQEKLKSSCKDFFSAILNNGEHELLKVLACPEWKYYQEDAKSLEEFLGSITDVTIGEPFKVDSNLYSGVYVPYKLRFKDGQIKEWQIAIKYSYDNNGKISWYIDGGI